MLLLCTSRTRSVVWALNLLGMCFVCGCSPKAEGEVYLRSTVDKEVAAPILGAFHRSEQKLIQPRASFGNASFDGDVFVESLKTGIDPENETKSRGDVVWTDNLFLMLRLQRSSLLMPTKWRVDPSHPAELRADDQTWFGFAATARVLLVNTDRLKDPKQYPRSVDELVDERWRGRCAVARPVAEAGAVSVTAAIHAAVIGHAKGDDAEKWFSDLITNAVILPGNTSVASAVAQGQVDWGLTDSVNAIAQLDDSSSVAIVFPDQSTSDPGTVRIPNAVAVLRDASHPVAAARLANYLVLPTTEDRLAMSEASLIPLSRNATYKPRVLGDAPVRWAAVDFVAAEKSWQTLQPLLQKLFAAKP